MSIPYHPEQGTILICDFKGFIDPEMVKRRPVVVVSPRLRQRGKLCAVVPLGTIFKLLITQGSMQVHEAPVSINNLQVTGGKTGIPNDNNRSRLGIEIPILISIIGPPKVI